MRYRETLIVKPGQQLSLKSVAPASTGHHESESAAKDEIDHYRSKLTAAAPLCGEKVVYSDRAAGHGCRRQGRRGQSRA
jgi:hypothetical protein